MANVLYTNGKQQLLAGAFSLGVGGNTMKTTLTDHGVITPNPATNLVIGDILAGTVGVDQLITPETNTGGVYDGSDINYLGLQGNSVESINIYESAGAANLRYLLVYIDQGTNMNGGFTPNGGNVTIQWDPQGIFRI